MNLCTVSKNARVALTPGPSPNFGRGVAVGGLTGRFPFSHDWEKGVGDEGVQKVCLMSHGTEMV